VPFADEQVRFTAGDRTLDVRYRHLGADRVSISVLDASHTVHLVATEPDLVFEDSTGLRRRAHVTPLGSRWVVSSLTSELTLTELPRFPDAAAETVAGGCIAPMPGKVVKVLVAEGDPVTAGQTLLVLEAMKMEHTVRSPSAGTLSRLAVTSGDQVDTGALLAVIS
jgi:biotin carboxyl carrier protein